MRQRQRPLLSMPWADEMDSLEVARTLLQGDARSLLGHERGTIRAQAYIALGRKGELLLEDRRRARDDPDSRVRLAMLCAEAPSKVGISTAMQMTYDPDAVVADRAIWTLGELADPAAVPRLCELAQHSAEMMLRESAIAALGAIGDPRALPLIVAAITKEKVYVRRRAVVASAAFDGPEIQEAREVALKDRDAQVRALVEDLQQARSDPRWNG